MTVSILESFRRSGLTAGFIIGRWRGEHCVFRVVSASFGVAAETTVRGRVLYQDAGLVRVESESDLRGCRAQALYIPEATLLSPVNLLGSGGAHDTLAAELRDDEIAPAHWVTARNDNGWRGRLVLIDEIGSVRTAVLWDMIGERKPDVIVSAPPLTQIAEAVR